MNHILPVLLVACAAVPASAQWLHEPTRGVPRRSDGKVDMTAPAPRTAEGRPDLSGLWAKIPSSSIVDVTQDLDPTDVKPWARERFRQNVEEFAKNSGECFLP